MQDTSCSKEKIEEMLAMQNLGTPEPKVEVVDDSDLPIALIIIIIAVVVVIAIAVAVTIFCIRKRNKKNTVTYLENDKQPETQNNSQALPEIATEDCILPSARSESKTSERQKIMV